MTLWGYITNILYSIKKFMWALFQMCLSIFGRKVEGFKNGADDIPYISVTFLMFSLLSAFCVIVVGYGAANLSYCYNKSLGKTDMEAMLWAVLAFMMNPIYYPYYGIFLNPVCSKTAMTGGRRH
jgi:hypothetical protein